MLFVLQQGQDADSVAQDLGCGFSALSQVHAL